MAKVQSLEDPEVREVVLDAGTYRIQVIQQNDDIADALYVRADYFLRSGDDWMLVGSTRIASDHSDQALDQAEEILRKDPDLQLTREFHI